MSLGESSLSTSESGRKEATVDSQTTSSDEHDSNESNNIKLPWANDASPPDNDFSESIGESQMDENDPLEMGMLHGMVDQDDETAQNDNSENPESSVEHKNRDSSSGNKSIMRSDTGEPNGIPADSEDSRFSLRDGWKEWNPLVIICALLLLAGLVVGIVLISQTRRPPSAASTVPSSSNEISHHPSIYPSVSYAPSSFDSRAPNILASVSPAIAQSEESTLYPIQTSPPTRIPTLSPSPEPTAAPSGSPIQQPTSSPTTEPTLVPSALPTQPPSPSPSAEPSLRVTALPSVSPTQPKVSPEVSINDVCTGAIGPLLSDFSSNFGTLANAGVDSVDRCGDVRDSGPGVWYYTIGTGGEMMAHTCLDTSFNSKITVFGGTCDKPVCIEANDDYCGSGTSQSAVSWDSVYGEIYFIYVTGNSGFENGSFNIVIGARSNDECSTAIGPLTAEDPLLVSGSTIGATANDVSCDGFVNESNSVWYLVRGTGAEMTVDWCEKTNFSARITVLTGSCIDLECTTLRSEDKCRVTWKSEVSRSYYILVGGKKSNDVGNFSLRLSTSDLPYNDKCEDAIGPLALNGIPIEGSTALASANTEVPFCITSITANGLWYFVKGNGSIIQASLCDSLSYDTRISIYRGNCIGGNGVSDLLCVDGNDDFCGEQSLVTWDSEVGVTYYILIHGYLDNSGDFSLTVTEL